MFLGLLSHPFIVACCLLSYLVEVDQVDPRFQLGGSPHPYVGTYVPKKEGVSSDTCALDL